MKKTKNNRRTFLKTQAAAAAGFIIVPRNVLGKGFQAPSDTLNLAAIGAGGKGWSDIRNASNEKEKVVALCDIDSKQAARSIEKWPKATLYSDFREMLEKEKDIDAVTISTPDHMHGLAAITAMQLGKHVYVQKPLTHNIKEARLLTKYAEANNIVSQMGNQGASNPDQQLLIEWFESGIIGDVDKVHIWTNRPVWPQGIPVPTEKMNLPDQINNQQWDQWVGPASFKNYHPLYHPFKWRGWWDFGTGALGDMGCHLIDPAFRVLQLGYPKEVECSVGQVFLKDWTPEYIPEGCPPSSHVQLKFDPTPVNNKEITLVWYDGGIRPFHPSIVPPDHDLGEPGSGNGVMLIGSKGVIMCSAYGQYPKAYLNSGEIITRPKDYEKKFEEYELPNYGHQQSWIEAIKAGFDSKEHRSLTSSFNYAGPLTETVLMGNIAIRSYQEKTTKGKKSSFEGRKKFIWDGENMKITNSEEANKFVGRSYRSGWEITGL